MLFLVFFFAAREQAKMVCRITIGFFVGGFESSLRIMWRKKFKKLILIVGNTCLKYDIILSGMDNCACTMQFNLNTLWPEGLIMSSGGFRFQLEM